MKKLTALILALMMLTAVFAGCGDSSSDTDGTSDNDLSADTPTPPDSGDSDSSDSQSSVDSEGSADDLPASSSDTPAKPDEPVDTRVYDSKIAEALITTAESYLARRTYIQYDDTRLVSGDAIGITYRWQNGVNSPEDCTSQYTAYSNCAAFCYDVYYYALGLDIGTRTTAQMMDATDMHVYRYSVTGNEDSQKKDEIKKLFNSQLQQGDLIVYRNKDNTNGHVMLYIGDGQIIHCCATGGGNYDYSMNKDALEPRGAIVEMQLEELWTEASARYMFSMMNFAIVRPTIKYTDAAPSEECLNRIANLKKIYVEKTSSHGAGYTAAPGDEVTFTFTLRSNRTSDTTVDITDTVPSNTTFVSGDCKREGDKLTWTVAVPSGQTVKVSYTVKVDPNAKTGDLVYSENSTVGGVTARARKIYIGKNLTADLMQRITAAAESSQTSALRGMALAQKLYADIGISLTLKDENTLLSSLYKPQAGRYYYLNVDSEDIDILAPTMYGGYYTGTCATLYDGVRTRAPLMSQLMAGDIVVCEESGKVQSYMVINGNRLFDLTNGKLLDLVTAVPTLYSTIGYDRFAIIRPAMR
ncbi:MAG: C40 family peptidase [Clostridia bacterium]|nr:C40 family peptidase [Clostridia bacterium]